MYQLNDSGPLIMMIHYLRNLSLFRFAKMVSMLILRPVLIDDHDTVITRKLFGTFEENHKNLKSITSK